MTASAKKRFGQHFLRDTGILDRIVRCIRPLRQDVLLEIGAGHGALSERLSPEVSRLLAVEVDKDCIPALEQTLSHCFNVVVVHEDILQLDIPALVRAYLPEGQSLRIAGNLPYNIATTIIDRLLDLPVAVEDMTFMVQLEVAERITANPRTRSYGFFSVRCQHLAEVRIGLKVPPACFVPRPRVMSAVVSFRLHNRPSDPVLEDCLMRLTKAAFSYRRKTLANSFKRHPEISPVSEELFLAAGINGGRRAEDLSVQEYEALARAYQDLQARNRDEPEPKIED